MNKIISFFIYTVFFAMMIGIVDLPSSAMAEGMDSNDTTMGMMRKKRYRYRRRTHRVQITASYVPWHREPNDSQYTNLSTLYGYNFGYFELGPFVRAFNQGGGQFRGSLDFSLGGWMDLNLIRNTRRNKFVPSLGIQAGYLLKDLRTHNLILSPRISFKYFVASRTGFAFSVYYEMYSLFQQIFRNMRHGIGTSISYVHYFH